jgi:hypothetical protein
MSAAIVSVMLFWVEFWIAADKANLQRTVSECRDYTAWLAAGGALAPGAALFALGAGVLVADIPRAGSFVHTF